MKFHTTLVDIELAFYKILKEKKTVFSTDFVLVQFKEDTQEKAGVSTSKQCLQIAYQSSLYTTSV